MVGSVQTLVGAGVDVYVAPVGAGADVDVALVGAGGAPSGTESFVVISQSARESFSKTRVVAPICCTCGTLYTLVVVATTST